MSRPAAPTFFLTASPPFLRVLNSKTPKIEHFLGGELLPLDLLKEGTARGCYTLSDPHSSLFFNIWGAFFLDLDLDLHGGERKQI